MHEVTLAFEGIRLITQIHALLKGKIIRKPASKERTKFLLNLKYLKYQSTFWDS